MGIYDRDYYRDRRGFSPFDSRIQAWAVLVIIYVCVFVLQALTRDVRGGMLRPAPLTELLELRADKVMDGEVWRLVTYSFLHDPATIWPIFVNCLFLFWFGRGVEDRLGWKEFLAYYLAATFLGGLIFTAVAGIADVDFPFTGPAFGVTAVMFLFALHDPRRTVLLFFVLPCPVWVIVAFQVLYSVSSYLDERLPAAVFLAHAAAAGFAYAYFRYGLHISSWLPGMPSPAKRRPNLHLFEGEPERPNGASGVPATAGVGATYATAGGGATASALLDEHLEAKLDEVLEKVKKHGQDSLTQEERAVLFRASEIYRKRRKSGGD